MFLLNTNCCFKKAYNFTQPFVYVSQQINQRKYTNYNLKNFKSPPWWIFVLGIILILIFKYLASDLQHVREKDLLQYNHTLSRIHCKILSLIIKYLLKMAICV